MKALTLISSAIALTAIAGLAAPQAQAAKASLTCSTGSVTSNPLAGGSSLSYSQCLNPVKGNDVTSTIDGSLTTFLDQHLGTGWIFDSKYEGGRSASGPNTYGFSWVQDGKGSGSWSLSQAISSPFVISLKAGNQYTSYYVDGSDSTLGGNWATFDQKDLSHASIFVGRPEEPNTAVSEPAATAALVLFGLTAVGVSKKQRAEDC